MADGRMLVGLCVLGCVITGVFTIEAEVFMNVSQLITSKGYPCEEHEVHTADGYILQVQRIPYGKNLANDGNRPVALLQHGLLSCSACWVENFANDSLGFMMADAGYDVWLGNSRGNLYGKKHKHLDVHSKEFWDFNWDEMAQFDLPATVDYVLQKSQASQLVYVGHSQGCEIAFAALSENPDLRTKIRAFVALAPAVFLGHMTSPLKYLSPIEGSLEWLTPLFGSTEFMPNSGALKVLGGGLCSLTLPSVVCENFLLLIGGFDAKFMNETRIPVYVGQHPAGTSTQNIMHYGQAYRSKKFKKYDHGLIGNLKKYNKLWAPDYPLENIHTPVLLYSGSHDWLVSPTDVSMLVPKINNLVKHKIIPEWNHLDFMWATNAPAVCYNDVIQELKTRF